MKPLFKNILTIIILFGLVAGVSYLGIQLTNLNQSEKSQSTIPSNEDSPQYPLPSENQEVSPDELAIYKQYQSCRSTLECRVITEPTGTTPDGQEITNNTCLNVSYLESCSNCREDKGFQAELAKQKTCSCVNNLCDLIANDGSDAIRPTEQN